MRQLVIHAGLPKTGSSALQVALARHEEYLSQEGIHYPELGSVAIAKTGAITSGNGASVAAFLNGNDKHKGSMDLCLETIAKGQQPTTLLSSELFYSARPDRLAGFLGRVREAGFDTRVVFFVRSLYEWAWSAYVQNVKNHGVSANFADWVVTSKIANAIPITIQKYQTAMNGGDIVQINYDTYRNDVFAAFAKHALLAKAEPPETVGIGQVNRSLSASEIEALRAFNRIRQGRPGGQQLSNALISTRPNLEVPAAPLHPSALEILDGKYDGVRTATADAVGGPVDLRRADDSTPDTTTDNADDVDRILMLLLYSRTIDNTTTLNGLKDKLDGGNR